MYREMSWRNACYVDKRIIVQLITRINELYREMSWRNAYYADKRIVVQLITRINELYREMLWRNACYADERIVVQLIFFNLEHVLKLDLTHCFISNRLFYK